MTKLSFFYVFFLLYLSSSLYLICGQELPLKTPVKLPFEFECENKVVSTHASSDSLMKAVFFERDCGATTSVSYHVILLGVDEEFEYIPDKIIFTCKRLNWINISWGKRELFIDVDCGRIYKTIDEIDGISVEVRLKSSKREKAASKS